MSTPHDMIDLSQSLQDIRALTFEPDINVDLQERKFLALAERMTQVARCARQAMGILFELHLKELNKAAAINVTTQKESDNGSISSEQINKSTTS